MRSFQAKAKAASLETPRPKIRAISRPWLLLPPLVIWICGICGFGVWVCKVHTLRNRRHSCSCAGKHSGYTG